MDAAAPGARSGGLCGALAVGLYTRLTTVLFLTVYFANWEGPSIAVFEVVEKWAA